MKNLNIIVVFIAIFNFNFLSTAEKANTAGKSSVDNLISNMLSADESKTISIIMQTMLPSMFGLFSNITSDDYKANFKEPCRFESLLDIFSKLPPYFDIISAKYPGKPDIAAYYSMQLASTFLVNNGSLTMACLYNMLSLQTRLMKFSLNIMDNPENNPELVGKFGIFMKPVMGMLKKNAMMEIIKHVDQYDKNDDLNTVNLFNLLNFFYCLIGVFGILSNMLLVILLKRSSIRRHKNNKKIDPKKKLPNKQNIYESRKSNLKQQQSMQLEPLTSSNYANVAVAHVNSLKKKRSMNRSSKTSELVRKKSTRKSRHNRKKKEKSEYSLVKSVNNQFNRIIRKRYKTRLCFIIIAICHSLYILFNFIVMSQAGLAAFALQGLSKLSLACKISFFLFPPTTAYNLLHQVSIWLLFYAILKHSRKLRNTMTHNFDRDADYDVNLMTTDTESYSESSDSESSDSSDDEDEAIEKKKNHYDSLNDDEDDTISQSLTNNSSSIQHQVVATNPNPNNQLALIPAQVDPFPLNITSPINNKSTVHFMNENGTLSRNQQIYSNVIHPTYYNPVYQPPVITRRHPYQDQRLISKSTSNQTKTSLLCFLFERKSRNALFCVILFAILLIYNSQNIFFYSLIELKTAKNEIITYCAFEETYSEYYNIINQYIVPLLNLFLFSVIPLLLCTIQVLFDVCFLIRVQREQTKRYEKLKDIIEWPLYSYYMVYIVSQLPLACNQISDLIVGTIKFPFVFPIFIQMKFTSHVWIIIIEMTLIILAYSSDLFIWLICDKHMRQLCKNWLKKRILCRTYSKSSSSSSTGTTSTSSSSSIHSIKQQNHRKMKLSSLSGSSNSNGAVSSSSSTNSNTDSNYLTLATDKNPKSNEISSDNNVNGKKSINNPTKSNYASSTLSSTSSSILNTQNTNISNKTKKSISPNIVESVKASASLSASASFDVANSTPSGNSKLPNLNFNHQQGIRMIDTDNETENEQQPGSPLHQNGLEKLDEDEELKKLGRHYISSDSQPPSFKTAVSKTNYSNVMNIFNNNRNHQYENHFNFNNTQLNDK